MGYWIIAARIGGGDAFVVERGVGVGANVWTSDYREAQAFHSREAAAAFVARHFTGPAIARNDVRPALVPAAKVEGVA